MGKKRTFLLFSTYCSPFFVQQFIHQNFQLLLVIPVMTFGTPAIYTVWDILLFSPSFYVIENERRCLTFLKLFKMFLNLYCAFHFCSNYFLFICTDFSFFSFHLAKFNFFYLFSYHSDLLCYPSVNFNCFFQLLSPNFCCCLHF